MVRFLALSAALLLSEFCWGQGEKTAPPEVRRIDLVQITELKAKQDALVGRVPVQTMRTVTVMVPVVVQVDGMQRTQVVPQTQTRMETTYLETVISLKDAGVHTGDGKRLQGDDRWVRLARAEQILLVRGAKIHPDWFRLLRPEAVVVIIPETQNLGGPGAVPVPVPVPIPVPPPPPPPLPPPPE